MKRTLRTGQSILITDHPTMPSLIGRTGRVSQLPMTWKECGKWNARHLQREEFKGDDKTKHRVWVRLDGVEGLEYGVPFNCLMFEEVEEEGEVA